MDILVAWLLCIAALSLATPHVTPPGGLTGIDLLLILSLPVGAFLAGRRRFSGLAFFVYGCLGTLVFVPAYLSDGNLGLKASSQSSRGRRCRVLDRGHTWNGRRMSCRRAGGTKRSQIVAAVA